jgi:hypothetical protein
MIAAVKAILHLPCSGRERGWRWQRQMIIFIKTSVDVVAVALPCVPVVVVDVVVMDGGVGRVVRVGVDQREADHVLVLTLERSGWGFQWRRRRWRSWIIRMLLILRVMDVLTSW